LIVYLDVCMVSIITTPIIQSNKVLRNDTGLKKPALVSAGLFYISTPTPFLRYKKPYLKI